MPNLVSMATEILTRTPLRWGPYPKMTATTYSITVPSFILLSQSERFALILELRSLTIKLKLDTNIVLPQLSNSTGK